MEHKRYWFWKNEPTSGQTDCVFAADDGVEDAIVKVGCRVEKVARGAWSFWEFCYENKKNCKIFFFAPCSRVDSDSNLWSFQIQVPDLSRLTNFSTGGSRRFLLSGPLKLWNDLNGPLKCLNELHCKNRKRISSRSPAKDAAQGGYQAGSPRSVANKDKCGRNFFRFRSWHTGFVKHRAHCKVTVIRSGRRWIESLLWKEICQLVSLCCEFEGFCVAILKSCWNRSQ